MITGIIYYLVKYQIPEGLYNIYINKVLDLFDKEVYYGKELEDIVITAHNQLYNIKMTTLDDTPETLPRTPCYKSPQTRPGSPNSELYIGQYGCLDAEMELAGGRKTIKFRKSKQIKSKSGKNIKAKKSGKNIKAKKSKQLKLHKKHKSIKHNRRKFKKSNKQTQKNKNK